ncbi:MAG: putative Ig domain-containing protein [Bryobacterales bacterium]|nr:putative Ig domain-containing protein [Bryobacterales bacterium]
MGEGALQSRPRRPGRRQGRNEFRITIVGSGLQITTTRLPEANVGCGYGANLLAAGGTPPYTFRLLSNNLFAGISLAPDGRVSGTPTEGGNRILSVEVSDSQMRTTQAMVGLLVGERLEWATGMLPNGTVAVPYPETSLMVMGGVPPLTFSAVEALPSGLSLSSSGVLSGTPSSVFDGIVQFRAESLTGCRATTAIPLRILVAGPSGLELSCNSPAVELRSEYEAVVNTNAPANGNLAGTLALSFISAVEDGRDNPEVSFATDPRSRTAAFNVPVGESRGRFAGGDSVRFNSGTVAGRIVLLASIPNASRPLSDTLEYVIPATPPRILSMRLERSGSTLTITATGFAPRRRISGGTLELVPRSGVTLSGSSTIPLAQLSGIFQTYFQTEASRNFGSQFVLNLPLSITGGLATDIAEVRLTLVGDTGENSNTQSAQ